MPQSTIQVPSPLLSRPEWLHRQYDDLKLQQKEIAAQMAAVDWEYHCLTGGWIQRPRKNFQAIAVARFALMSREEKLELGHLVETYIREHDGECLALELAETFGDRIPYLSFFMRQFTIATKRGEKRAMVYEVEAAEKGSR